MPPSRSLSPTPRPRPPLSFAPGTMTACQSTRPPSMPSPSAATSTTSSSSSSAASRTRSSSACSARSGASTAATRTRKPLFRSVPGRAATYVLTKPGAENAGAIDIGDGLCVVMKIESHNHPSAIEPYQGAATGVGGIVRDIFAMGARPIAILDSLRFGPLDDPQNRYLFERRRRRHRRLRQLPRHPHRRRRGRLRRRLLGNPLVNAMCVGVAPSRRSSSARRPRAPATSSCSSAPTPAATASTAPPASPRRTDPDGPLRGDAPRRPGRQPVPGEDAPDGGLLRARLRSTATGSSASRTSAPPASPSSVVECCRQGRRRRSSSTSRKCPAAKQGMTPYEVMLSETQERMLDHRQARARGRRCRALRALGAPLRAIIGEVTSDGISRASATAASKSAALPVEHRHRSRPSTRREGVRRARALRTSDTFDLAASRT